MSGRAADVPGGPLAELIAGAEPGGSRPIGQLIERLAAEGRLRTVLRAGVAVDPAAVGATSVAGVSDDSRRVRPGDLFVAIHGEHVDGHDKVASAIAAGAVAAIVERAVDDATGLQVVVDRSASALASAAAWWYGNPSRELSVVGITGTDGKTTTSYLVAAALEAAGIATGLVGTIETRVGPIRQRVADHVTTPGAIRLQQLLRAMAQAGDRAAVIETTSHGLAAERVGGVAYDAAIFTNLSHEHLEFHGTFEAYRAAKLSLFERLAWRGPAKPDGRPRLGVVNVDDPAGPLFAEATRAAGVRLVGYGLDRFAEVRAASVEETARGLHLDVVAPGWAGPLELRLAGRYNAHNALAAIALGIGWGLDPDAVRTGLEAVAGVPGRMERIDRGQPFEVVVDFAHSPAALETVLDLLGPVAASSGGGLIAVFGSAGERDRAKRPMMGRVAGERCRLIVLTDEDPRREDRLGILDEIAAGAEAVGRRRGVDLLLIADRTEAILAAFERATAGDVVVLAGKGHEPTIEQASGPVAWDERATAEQVLAGLGYAPGLLSVRGCLTTLALLVVVAIGATWLVLPPIAGTLAQGALVASGFNADAMTVTVTSDLPPRLLSLQADRVRVQATNARFHGLGALDVDLILHHVRLIDRSFDSLDGTLHDVTATDASGDSVTIPLAVLSGTPDRIQAIMTLPATDAEELAAEAIRKAIGIAPSRVVLTAPDRIRVEAKGLAIVARLAVDARGALMLIPPSGGQLGSLTLVEPGPDAPYRIESFRIVDGDLIVVATLDPHLG